MRERGVSLCHVVWQHRFDVAYNNGNTVEDIGHLRFSAVLVRGLEPIKWIVVDLL